MMRIEIDPEYHVGKRSRPQLTLSRSQVAKIHAQVAKVITQGQKLSIPTIRECRS